MAALLIGVNENGKLKFAGRVGTGFSEKLLKFLRPVNRPVDVQPATAIGSVVEPASHGLRPDRRS